MKSYVVIVPPKPHPDHSGEPWCAGLFAEEAEADRWAKIFGGRVFLTMCSSDLIESLKRTRLGEMRAGLGKVRLHVELDVGGIEPYSGKSHHFGLIRKEK